MSSSFKLHVCFLRYCPQSGINYPSQFQKVSVLPGAACQKYIRVAKNYPWTEFGDSFLSWCYYLILILLLSIETVTNSKVLSFRKVVYDVQIHSLYGKYAFLKNRIHAKTINFIQQCSKTIWVGRNFLAKWFIHRWKSYCIFRVYIPKALKDQVKGNYIHTFYCKVQRVLAIFKCRKY